jgi:hypothetical protein
MSFSSVVNKELADKLAGLTVQDFEAVIRVASLGMKPSEIYNAAQATANGDEYSLPSGGGRPNPITIQAWSFVKDHGQFHDTYGLSSARAGELTDLLRTDQEKGIAEITAVVTAALRKKGSPKPVIVTLGGMPGAAATDHGGAPIVGGGRTALKDEIRRNAATYGLYKFVAIDTGRSGAHRFAVGLGGGLWAVSASKAGAVDVARICRVKGRADPLVADHVAFLLAGQTPRFGGDIPGKVSFSGKLDPSATPPADPVARDTTVSPPPPPAGGGGGSAGGSSGRA